MCLELPVSHGRCATRLRYLTRPKTGRKQGKRVCPLVISDRGTLVITGRHYSRSNHLRIQSTSTHCDSDVVAVLTPSNRSTLVSKITGLLQNHVTQVCHLNLVSASSTTSYDTNLVVGRPRTRAKCSCHQRDGSRVVIQIDET